MKVKPSIGISEGLKGNISNFQGVLDKNGHIHSGF